MKKVDNWREHTLPPVCWDGSGTSTFFVIVQRIWVNFFKESFFSWLKDLFALVEFSSDPLSINSPAVYFTEYYRNSPHCSLLTFGQVIFWTPPGWMFRFRNVRIEWSGLLYQSIEERPQPLHTVVLEKNKRQIPWFFRVPNQKKNRYWWFQSKDFPVEGIRRFQRKWIISHRFLSTSIRRNQGVSHLEK
jgi:hypothetical protein